MEQFHPEYNPDAVGRWPKRPATKDWVNLISRMSTRQGCCGYLQDADLPVLWPWDLTVGYGENTTQVSAERNPYYWKVDTEGNQLPYIDQVVYDVGKDVEVLVLQGHERRDRLSRIATSPPSTTRLSSSTTWSRATIASSNQVPADNNVMEISLNLTHQDPVKREIFTQQGLPHRSLPRHQPPGDHRLWSTWARANRGRPPRCPIRPTTTNSWPPSTLEYDVDLANEYLDKAGYTERDADGFRLGPDGNRISFLIDVPDGQQPR